MMIPDTPYPVHEVHVNYSDILAGIRHDARVATAEGFPRVAARAEALERELEAALANARTDLGNDIACFLVFRTR